MGTAALAAIAANIVWTDALGTATLTAGNLRFSNWTPDVDDIGQEEVAYGTGATYNFIERTDYTATFDLDMQPPSVVPLLNRLKRWLNQGGSVTINTEDVNENSYTCTKKPGFKIAPPRLDTTLLRYTLSLGVLNTQSQPLVCLYSSGIPATYVVTVTPNSVALGPNVGAQQALTVTVADANGNPVTGLVPQFVSANPGIANVTSAGVVTAVASGGTSINVTVGGQTTLVPVAVTLSQTPQSISLSPSSLAFTATTYTTPNPTPGKSGVPSQTVTATLLNGAGQSVPVTPGMLIWTSTGGGVNLVDNGNGTCTVTAIAGSAAGNITAALASNPTGLTVSIAYTTVPSNPIVLIPNTYSLVMTAAGQQQTLTIQYTLDQYGVSIP